jgi:hypothetical protein
MMTGMSIGTSTKNEVATFIHGMIPHHQNAVNMAKTVLKLAPLNCEDLTQQEDPKCLMEYILRDIITTQNHQIQLMRNVLEAMALPQVDDCVVHVNKDEELNPAGKLDVLAYGYDKSKYGGKSYDTDDYSS